MNHQLIRIATLALFLGGCPSPRSEAGQPRSDSAVGLAGRTSVPHDLDRLTAATRSLEPGDTFDLRISGGVSLGSREALTLPCAARPPASEFLYILDSTNYAVSRVAYDCAKQSTKTVGFQSTYKLVGDTVQFYEGDGNETFVSDRAVVSRDSMITVGTGPQSQLQYSRRPSSHKASQ